MPVRFRPEAPNKTKACERAGLFIFGGRQAGGTRGEHSLRSQKTRPKPGLQVATGAGDRHCA
jgi:hypothetical protein